MSETPKPVWRNWVTVGGAVLALLALLFNLSFLFFELVTPSPSPYIGVWTYLVFPGLMVIGALAAAAGLWVAGHRRRGKWAGAAPVQYYPRIDLNLASHRRALGGVGVVVALALPVIGLLSYRGYHYTDSTDFCGRVCHEVMEPQHTAFVGSPHARVECAECHIGAGASWYVKSKLSGLRQVLAVLRDSFPRPIPPAIRELRPATETCQQCHWPAKFFGDQLRVTYHYSPDEANTPEVIRMLVKTGGNDPSTGPPRGIHWHMALGFTVEFVATDDYLQDIPWVKMIDGATGGETVYRADGLGTDQPPPQGTRRLLDCMDCHNRPTHVFRSPDREANVALLVNPSLQSLPFAKRELVAALVVPYADKEAGLAGVEAALRGFYEEQHPDVNAARQADIDRLVAAARRIYQVSFFPSMNVRWTTYPDNIGHKEFNGCFRCHDGKHVNGDGEAISTDCRNCHTFLTPPDPERPELVREGDFTHPVPLEDDHAELLCTRCHDGGVAKPTDCDECHDLLAGLPADNGRGTLLRARRAMHSPFADSRRTVARAGP